MSNKNINRKGYKDTKLGWIPVEWDIEKIKDFGKVVTGNTPPTNESSNYGEEHLFVSPADLGKRKYIKNTNKKLSERGFKLTRRLPKGAVLETCIGSTIGKLGIAQKELATNQCNNL